MKEDQVLGLLEEMLDAGKTPEEVCCDCPELLPEVRRRWQEFCLIDAQVGELLPGLRTLSRADATTVAPVPPSRGLPQIPGYSVEAVLGQGGMGVVFKARHLRLNRVIALKMALAGAYARPHERERFQRESEAVAALRHPNVVQIHDVGDSEGRPYFTMEYVEGGSLAQKLAGTPQPAREAATLVATLAGAVHAAHASGIVHRDLKPANVLLTADGTPKVTDFGLARRLGGEAGLTRTGTAVGTPSYMAPEQACGPAEAVGPATDVYALGAILYELLTGRPPFRAETAAETVLQVIHQDPVPPSRLNGKVPRDLETICLKCLRKEPQGRYASAMALAEDLRRYLLGQAIAAQPVSRLARVGKWVRRNPAIASLSAAAVFTLLAGTVVSVLFALEARRQEGLATERADQLERQASALEEKTREALAKKTEAEQARAEAERNLVSGILSPIGRNPLVFADLLNPTLPEALDPTEADVMGQLRAASMPIRLQLLETALRQPESARRVGRRADWVMQAIVGCDRDRRAEVRQLLVRRIAEPEPSQEVLLACAQLGVALNLDERVWAERAAAALSAALRDPLTEREDYPKLAESLAAVCEHLLPPQAADHAARALDVFLARLRDPAGITLAYNQLTQAVAALSRWLDATAATRAGEAIEAVLRRPGTHPLTWPALSRALVAVCRQLPTADAAPPLDRTVDFILDTQRTTNAKSHYRLHAEALGELCGRLDAERANRLAEAIIAILGDSEMIGTSRSEFISQGSIAAALVAVAERLDPPGCLRATEALVLVLRKAGNILVPPEQLRTALVSLCRRLDAAGAARVSHAIAAAVTDPKTSVEARTILADALVPLSGQLDSAQAAALENALVDSLIANMAETRSLLVGPLLARALASVGGRPGAKSAARTAEAFSAAIRSPQAQLELLKPLAAALAVVSGQLPPEEAAAHAHRVVDVLGSLWVARTKPPERASLALALAPLWPRLSPTEAAAHARRVSADLEEALRDPEATPSELARLTEALTAVWKHVDPADRVVRANSAADTFIAAIRRPRNDVQTISPLLQALTTLCASLDRPGVVRVAHVQIAVFTELNTERYRYAFHMMRVLGFDKVAAQLDERELQQLLEHPLAAGRLQRTVLDVLGGLKNLSFRNTWDYLDWTRARDSGTDVLSPGPRR
jgi:tRNA A-37 threonylcarbamoyl transferase component Bud32